MSEKKTIQINPELFRIPEKQKRPPRTNKPIRVKNPNMPKNKTVRNQIMKMIRAKQQDKYKELFDDKESKKNVIAPVSPIEDFKRDFNQSLEYLSDLAKRETEKVPQSYKRNQTLRARSSPIMENVSLELPNVFDQVQVSPDMSHSMILSPNNKNPYVRPVSSASTVRPTQLASTVRPVSSASTVRPVSSASTVRPVPSASTVRPNQLASTVRPPFIQSSFPFDTPSIPNRILPPPPYGALKVGGTKPTYRTWTNNQTAKNREPLESTIGNPNSIENIKRLSELRKKMAIKQKEEEEKKGQKNPVIRRLKQKKIYKRTYRLGRSKHQAKIGVLVSNKTIRSNISTRTQLLKQEPIQDIKKFLIKKGLIKVGTPTPNDILRKMYESVVLICGEVQNYNPENLLYNYVHDTK